MARKRDEADRRPRAAEAAQAALHESLERAHELVVETRFLIRQIERRSGPPADPEIGDEAAESSTDPRSPCEPPPA